MGKNTREKWQPLEKGVSTIPDELTMDGPAETWINDIYTVLVRRYMSCPFKSPLTWLSIKRNDKEPCRDWRHFQYIKNQLCGPECEGIELFPKESNLCDQSNQYHLWVFDNPFFSLGIGWTLRLVSEMTVNDSKQRLFPENMIPPDLAQKEALIRKELEKTITTVPLTFKK